METYIKCLLPKVYRNFSDDIQNKESLCPLKDVSYESSNIPDYNDPFIQQYYLLKYFPAYFAEYSLMYGDFLEEYPTSQLNILAVGAGIGVDLCGLHYELEKNKKVEKPNVKYTGVDKIDWKPKCNINNSTYRSKYINDDITTWNKLDRDDYNVIVFPKSICEFDKTSLSKLSTALENTAFSSSELYVLSSIRNQEHCEKIDFNSTEYICNTLKQHHFPHVDGLEDYYSYEDKGIICECKGFKYDDDILDSVKSIWKMCPKYKSNGKTCNEKCNTLFRSPILRTTYMKYQIIRLRK